MTLPAYSAVGSALLMRAVQMTRKTIFELEPELKTLPVPSLIVVGDQDAVPGAQPFHEAPHSARPGLLVLAMTGHTSNIEEPGLFNQQGSLKTDKPVKTIGSYWPYATTLWSYLNRAQPFDEPGTLTPDQVYAVTVYLLFLNGILGEHDVLDARTLPAISMPNRDGFVPDARPEVGKPAAPARR